MWQKVSKSFGQVAQEYDAWYQENPIFASEIETLRNLGPPKQPALEIGVGTGAFAVALGFDYGLDPSLEMLSLAREKGIKAVCGIAERQPFKDKSFNACGMFFTLCFLEDPKKALSECYRVLKPNGNLYLGVIPKDSPWGVYYEEKARQGHPLYRYARFLAGEELPSLLDEAGFRLKAGYSSLFISPKASPKKESPKEGLLTQAGFWAILAEKL
ncbi:class I SAM-dependent methyltransferase [Thermodesulfatator atlanticus]|uniref:class I SAM-dependent methyltransferase n=1 Tax=Thermodesulfatator atlanticus TaxID=501497 RepID=UPI0003B785F1|nr:class I SAM-dependent methyltransferase [Thermodesulfatator atlanticus]